jgi:hemerythrin
MDLTANNGELSVGVRILDYDHREMVEALYEIQRALTSGEDPRRTGSLLSKLANFSLTHFALEEGMMVATRYPGLARHRLNHQRITERMKALASRHKRDALTLDGDSLSFLSVLHTDHIQQDDLHYGLWLNEIGKR